MVPVSDYLGQTMNTVLSIYVHLRSSSRYHTITEGVFVLVHALGMLNVCSAWLHAQICRVCTQGACVLCEQACGSVLLLYRHAVCVY